LAVLISYCTNPLLFSMGIYLFPIPYNYINQTPTTNGYQSIQFFTIEQTLTLAIFPEFNLNVNQIF